MRLFLFAGEHRESQVSIEISGQRVGSMLGNIIIAGDIDLDIHYLLASGSHFYGLVQNTSFDS